MEQYIQSHINSCNRLLDDKDTLNCISNSINAIIKNFHDGLPLLVFGNGGSASDAAHLTGELVGKFKLERKACNAVCLNSNTSIITAIANDYSYSDVFSRQIEAYAASGALCFGLSTSGRSENMLKAFKMAKKYQMKTISLTGHPNNPLAKLSDISIAVPSKSTPEIQELHVIIYHYICEQIELSI